MEYGGIFRESVKNTPWGTIKKERIRTLLQVTVISKLEQDYDNDVFDTQMTES